MHNEYAIDAQSALEAAQTARGYLAGLLAEAPADRDHGRIKAANDAIGHSYRRAEICAQLAIWEEVRGIRTAIEAHGRHAAEFTGQGLTLAQRLEAATQLPDTTVRTPEWRQA